MLLCYRPSGRVFWLAKRYVDPFETSRPDTLGTAINEFFRQCWEDHCCVSDRMLSMPDLSLEKGYPDMDDFVLLMENDQGEKFTLEEGNNFVTFKKPTGQAEPITVSP